MQALAVQIKQLLRSGDAEGALRAALENAPYGGDAGAKVSACAGLCLRGRGVVNIGVEEEVRNMLGEEWDVFFYLGS